MANLLLLLVIYYKGLTCRLAGHCGICTRHDGYSSLGDRYGTLAHCGERFLPKDLGNHQDRHSGMSQTYCYMLQPYDSHVAPHVDIHPDLS